MRSVITCTLIRVIKLKRMTWAGNVARIREIQIIFWFENLKGGDHLGDKGVQMGG
jgi:hypothetical protein